MGVAGVAVGLTFGATTLATANPAAGAHQVAEDLLSSVVLRATAVVTLAVDSERL